MSDFSVLVDFLVCPDDHEALYLEGAALRCPACSRSYLEYSGIYWDLRPVKLCQKVREFGQAYLSLYRDLFEHEETDFSAIPAWGAAESNPVAWVKRRERHRDTVLSLIRSGGETSGSVLVDVSAGAGFYTIALAPYFRHVLHCDLSVASLMYASRLSQQLGIMNIIFLRIDNLALPFRRSLTHLLCLDSLISGDRHDLQVLEQIAGSLRSSGSAVVDFHNWWHNPIRRLGLLPDNFHNNRSYSRREAESLLRAADLDAKRYHGFVQEADSGKVLGRIVNRILPPTRFVYVVQPAAAVSASTPSKPTHPQIR